jgi:hypothetical protein
MISIFYTFLNNYPITYIISKQANTVAEEGVVTTRTGDNERDTNEGYPDDRSIYSTESTSEGDDEGGHMVTDILENYFDGK